MQEVDRGMVTSWVCHNCRTEIFEHDYDDEFTVEKIYRRRKKEVI